MRYLTLTCFIISMLVAISCRKKAIGLGEYYPELVGTWKNQGESTKINFRVNGKIILYLNSGRENSFKAVSVQQFSSGPADVLTLQFRDKKQKELLELEYNITTKKITLFNVDSLTME